MKNAELKYVASESEDLEVWVQTLLTIYPTIPNIERVISSIIESRAVSSLSTFFAPNGQAKLTSYDQVDRILSIIERKDKLIGLYHMIRDLIRPLNKEDMKFVEMRFFHRMKPEKIATLLCTCKRTVYRRTMRVVSKIASCCKERGITSEHLADVAKEEPWILAQLEKIKQDKAVNIKRGCWATEQKEDTEEFATL